MIVGVVLAAGESSRMGRPKALLPIEGVSFIERIVSALRATKVGEIIVVLGHNAEQMAEKIAHLPVRVVLNRDYKKGQLSSLLAAIRAVEGMQGADGILVHLVDHPYLSSPLVDTMIERFYDSKKSIVVPRHKGRRGHPVILSCSLFSELLATPLEEGAKAVVHAHRGETLELDTDEVGVTVDIDTPEEYRQHVRRE